MSDLLFRLASAIATAEGFFVAGSLPSRDGNPGDLRGAPWLVHPCVVNGFWQAATLAQGIAGLYHQIALDTARGMSLRQLISSWAPTSDGNDTENYIRETARRAAIADVDQPLQELLAIEPVP